MEQNSPSMEGGLRYERGPAGRSQFDGALRAMQQSHPNFLFEIENGLADRGLGHVQAAGGFAVVQMMSDADEVTQMAKLHNFMLIAESDYYKKIIRFQRLPMPCDTSGK
jgi:hypothetical protein